MVPPSESNILSIERRLRAVAVELSAHGDCGDPTLQKRTLLKARCRDISVRVELGSAAEGRSPSLEVRASLKWARVKVRTVRQGNFSPVQSRKVKKAERRRITAEQSALVEELFETMPGYIDLRSDRILTKLPEGASVAQIVERIDRMVDSLRRLRAAGPR